jgi:type IV pilus assembly protein PilM
MTKVAFKITKFLPEKNKLIGLDIGSFSIKLAELVRRQGRLVPTKLRLQEIDPHKAGPDGQSDALKNLFRDVNTQNARINVVVNCFQSCMKIAVIPFMPKSEIPQALKWEMKKFISFPVDQAIMDYEILQEIDEGDVKKLKIAIACCPKETIDRYLNLLKLTGVEPSLFTQHCLALRNVIAKLHSEDKGTVAILDVGYDISELFIFENREPVFNRKLPAGGRDFTLNMTQKLVSDHGKTELTVEQAESIKKKYGIVSSDDSNMLEGKITSAQLTALIRPDLEKLLTEIERSFAYYREKEQSEPVEQLILLGGGGNLKNLPEHLSEGLHIPVQLGNPLAAFPSSEALLPDNDPQTANRFASALGAALASPHDINLLPVEIKQRTRLLIKRSSIKALITAVVVSLMILYTGMRLSLGIYNKRIAAAELELKALSPQMEQVPGQVFLQDILNQRIYWSDALKEISNLISDQICLIEISTERRTLTLKGQIKSPALDREKILTNFMSSLEKGIFKKVSLISTKDSTQEKLNNFELRLAIE